MKKIGFFLALALGACAPFGEEVASAPCPPISAVAGVEQIYVASEEGRVLAVRFNGIDHYCRAQSGYTAMDLSVHVLAGRNLTISALSDRADIYLTAAVVNGAGRRGITPNHPRISRFRQWRRQSVSDYDIEIGCAASASRSIRARAGGG